MFQLLKFSERALRTEPGLIRKARELYVLSAPEDIAALEVVMEALLTKRRQERAAR